MLDTVYVQHIHATGLSRESVTPCFCRLGTRHGAAELKSHAFFKGLDWEHLKSMQAPNIPELEHELDTRNFENFDEDPDAPTSTSGGKWKKRADPTFMNFTYKSFQAVGRDEGMALLICSPLTLTNLTNSAGN